MKRSGFFVCLAIVVPILSLSQGTSCSTPIAIPMDGICRNYTTSSSTGSNVVCTSSGTTPVTYFSITANSSAQNMLLKITGPSVQWVEVAFYDGTSCTNGNLESASSICFYNGSGDWAPAPSFTITPNMTYIIRIKTVTTGNIQICGQYYTPPNNTCLTATSIGTVLTYDNNATHQPSGMNPAGLCAALLNNTAFYTYTVDVTGNSGISLENMDFDNNYESDLLNLGFQVGLFTGTCAGGLTSRACYIGVSTNTQLYTGSLPAGTVVYVAVDGILGSNCDFGIRAINAVILSVDLKSFAVWKNRDQNVLSWVTSKEVDNSLFEIQRSADGRSFTTIDRINGHGNSSSETSYEYIDEAPLSVCYYRLRIVDLSGEATYSKVIRVDRKADSNPKIYFSNFITNQLSLQVTGIKHDKAMLKIIDPSGRELKKENVRIMSGENTININTSDLSKGLHYLIFSVGDYQQAFPFIKS